jgi:hypothetical protein
MPHKGEKRVKYNERKLFDVHEAEAIKRFGISRWASANIGWGQSEGTISSKLYAINEKQHTEILTTWWDASVIAFKHTQSDY